MVTGIMQIEVTATHWRSRHRLRDGSWPEWHGTDFSDPKYLMMERYLAPLRGLGVRSFSDAGLTRFLTRHKA